MTTPERPQTGEARESGDHDLPWSWPRMSDADLSTRVRLTYIKGGEREALETACYWQERAIGAEKREATTQRELAEVKADGLILNVSGPKDRSEIMDLMARLTGARQAAVELQSQLCEVKADNLRLAGELEAWMVEILKTLDDLSLDQYNKLVKLREIATRHTPEATGAQEGRAQ